MSDDRAVALSDDPRVKFVEEDSIMTATVTQTNPPWGLDRIGQRDLPLNHAYSYTSTGSGVNAYIIDTGIRITHTQFGGRASVAFDAVGDGQNGNDCNGHGTHVSGTVGGVKYGVAKNVSLVAVRVLNCQGSGTTSGVIAGIDWVTANRVLPAAANMSLGGGLSTTLNQAVASAVASGVTFAVAAGNSSANACSSSPSSEPSAITVGATDINDGFAYFSNFGSCVDINAPGVSITSDWYSSNTATNTISGTSMAAPHVAGAAALYLSANPTATPAQVASALTTNATSGAITAVPAGTVNLLLYTGFIGGGAPPPPPPPPPPPSPGASTASFTKSCSSVTCSFDASGSTDATSYSWNFGDGTTASGVATSHRFGRNHSYTVTLTTQPASSTSTATTTVTCTPKGCS